MTEPDLLESLLRQVTERWDLETSMREGGVTVTARGGSPYMTSFARATHTSVAPYVHARTTSWDFGGERSDLNDMVSILLAKLMRTEAPSRGDRPSPYLAEIEHPVFEPSGELYARYILPAQPASVYDLVSDDGFFAAEAMMALVRMAELLLPYLNARADGEEETFSMDEREWASEALGHLFSQDDEHDRFMTCSSRTGPTVRYVRSRTLGMSVIESGMFASLIRFHSDAAWEYVDYDGGQLVIDGRTRNVIRTSVREKADAVLRRLGDPADAGIVIPLENAVVVVGEQTVVLVDESAGLEAFEQAREELRTRHEREALLVFSPEEFEWSKPVPDDRFEELVRVLLSEEPGVQEVRLAGATRDRDGGRDLLCRWTMAASSPTDGVTDTEPPLITRDLVVQCKALSRAVNKSDVTDIRDTIENHHADGYFLVVSSRLTGPLVTHLTTLRAQGRYAGWWTRAEIEDRLRRRSVLVAAFSDVVRPRG